MLTKKKKKKEKKKKSFNLYKITFGPPFSKS